MRRAEPQPWGAAWLLLAMLVVTGALRAQWDYVTHLHRPTETIEAPAIGHAAVRWMASTRADARSRQQQHAAIAPAARSRKDALTLTLLLLAAQGARATMSP